MKTLLTKIFRWKKRKDQRYTLDEHDLMIYDPNAPVIKEIINVSSGGISFVYEDTGKPLSKVFEIDIKVGDFFQLGKVRVTTISDNKMAEITSESKIFRRFNGRFLNIDLIQEYELEKFLNNYGKKI